MSTSVKLWVNNTATNVSIMQKSLKQMQLKPPSKRAVRKIAEATGDLFGNEFDNKITKVSKTSLEHFEKK